MKTVGGDLTVIDPPCCSTMFLHMESPNPVPVGFVVNNGSNTLEIRFAGIPDPVSSNSILMVVPRSLTRT